MQINVLPAAHPIVSTMMAFPEITQEAKQWVAGQLNHGLDQLTDLGRTYYDRALKDHRVFFDGKLERMARRITRAVKSLSHSNAIVPLRTVEELQSARPAMQRYIMANPNLRALYHKQLCDGYSDTYRDLEPTKIGEDHYEYRRVMNGIVQDAIDPESGEKTWMATYYFDDLHEGDRELDAEEQFDILDAWDACDVAVCRRFDPTDIFNGEIGG